MYYPIVHKDRLIAKAFIPPEEIEESALEQIISISEHPFVKTWIAVMPDVHAGKGATIGSVIPTEDVVIPSAVGVDIGCGMCCSKLPFKLDQIKPVLKDVGAQIKRDVPMGFNIRKIPHPTARTFFVDHPKIYYDSPIIEQLGTLGGGNHFIEIQVDKLDNVYAMIHSGSRNLGYAVARYYIKEARTFCQRYRINVPKDTEFLHAHDELGQSYLSDMELMVKFAKMNRACMMKSVFYAFSRSLGEFQEEPELLDVPHNYVSQEHFQNKNLFIHRKGATKAEEGQKGIIPGSMGSPSYIVIGKSNPDSYWSCSHGAGRVMSRTKAKQTITLEEFKASMQGVESWDVNKNYLDEAPYAYKNIVSVMRYQEDLVDIVVELKPVLNLKG